MRQRFVYCAELPDVGCIKIGRSTAPVLRLDFMRSTLKRDLDLCFMYEEELGLSEGEWHHRLRRVCGVSVERRFNRRDIPDFLLDYRLGPSEWYSLEMIQKRDPEAYRLLGAHSACYRRMPWHLKKNPALMDGVANPKVSLASPMLSQSGNGASIAKISEGRKAA